MAGVAYIQQQQQPQMLGRTEHLGSVNQFNQPQVTPFWCQARFDYHSQDPSLLSFSRGDIIEVHTQLTTGWWDGVLNNERGWFPSNYVVQLSDQEVESLLYQLENERPARESDWGSNTDYHDSVGDSTVTGNSSQDFWVPEVTNDGQVCVLIYHAFIL
jgi:son of sevenless-like protein